MEHNIWKDYCDESDFEEICGDNFKKIGISEPLLYLLSLVDTIEMTKKFCRYTDEGSEKEHFVYPKTLGRKVSMRILPNEIEIDYQGLREYIRENRYNDDISLWEDSVISLRKRFFRRCWAAARRSCFVFFSAFFLSDSCITVIPAATSSRSCKRSLDSLCSYRRFWTSMIPPTDYCLHSAFQALPAEILLQADVCIQY